jgi:hypothetical protein
VEGRQGSPLRPYISCARCASSSVTDMPVRSLALLQEVRRTPSRALVSLAAVQCRTEEVVYERVSDKVSE